MSKRLSVRARLVLGDQFEMVNALDRTKGDDAAVVASAALDKIEEMKTQAENNLLHIDDVEYRTGLSKTTIYQRIKDGTFPEQVSTGGDYHTSRVAWLESEVTQWIIDRANMRPTGL